MREAILAVALATAAFAVPDPATAQAAAPAPAAAPASRHTIAGNADLFSSYRFRGIDQTFGKPALQGGIGYSHESGFYAGNWNSNVNQGAGYPGGNLEMDFYGGWKKIWGDWGLDLGGIYYYYPGTNALRTGPILIRNNRTLNIHTGSVHNSELYIAGSWKFISLKYFDAVSDYFSTPNTKNSGYLDLSANYALGDGWGVNGHLGHLDFKNMSNGNYTDWKIGVTKDLSGWVVGLSYIDTNAKGNCGGATVANPQPYCFTNGNFSAAGVADKTKDAGRSTFFISVSKTF